MPIIRSMNPAYRQNVAFRAKTKNAQPQDFSETPKETPVKKESHAVRNGAIAGAAAHVIWDSISIIKAGGFSKAANKNAIELSKTLKKDISLSKTKFGALLLSGLAIFTGIGAGIGAIVKHFSNKQASN